MKRKRTVKSSAKSTSNKKKRILEKSNGTTVDSKKDSVNDENCKDPLVILLATEYAAQKPVNSAHSRESLSDDSESSWEDLDVGTSKNEDLKIQILQKSTKSDGPNAADSLTKHINQYATSLWNKFLKKQNLAIRKVHLLCFLSRGFFCSRMCSYSYVKSFALSTVPFDLCHDTEKHCKRKGKLLKAPSKSFIQRVITWYKKEFHVDEFGNRHECLLEVYSCKVASSQEMYIKSLVGILRVLGIPTRFVLHFSPSVIVSGISPSPKTRQSRQPKKTHEKKHEDAHISNPIIPFECDLDEGVNLWIEVFDGEHETWQSIDPYSLKLCNRKHIEDLLTFSSRTKKQSYCVAYTVAFGEHDSAIDVTARYASETLYSATRRERGPVELEMWWQKVLKSFKLESELETIEEKELRYFSSPECHPVPETISELHSHPLYVLPRHILKYEAIYPPDVEPVAKLKGETVYLRENVKPLHNESKWLQNGRSVKPGEKPIKEVLGLKKKSSKSDKPPLVSLFGEWQTVVFEPPVIVDDKIPRNQYGNYDLFQPWMLPKGTCHIKRPGIQMLARRLGIDYAPAMVGWEFHSGINHPVINGIIVCAKFQNTLERTWQEDQQAIEASAKTNKTTHALHNWKKMTKGLLLGEKLRKRYL